MCPPASADRRFGEDGKPSAAATGGRAQTIRRTALAAGLLILAGLFFLWGGDDLLSFEALARNRQSLGRGVEDSAVLASLSFLAVYAAITALSLPLGAVMTVASGLLFGPVWGTLLSVIGATAGATVVFLAAGRVAGPRLRARVASALRRMDAGFRENAFNYLLVLRLIPLFPFWLVNLAPAFAEVRLRTFVAATALGIVPGTFVFALVGNGFGALAAAGKEPGLDVILRPAVLAPVLGLAVLALVPVIYRKMRQRQR
jgi:uncharacterized membrane protein YdjX (TVP38/TMEM64 family)